LTSKIRPSVTSTVCEAIAPSSTANIGPGFDVFGLALDLFYDKVHARKLETRTGSIKLNISNNPDLSPKIPTEINSNSAGLSVKKLCMDAGIEYDIELSIMKGVPPGYGLGSSAASAVAAVIAVDHLFKTDYTKDRLVEFAAEGELASAGTRHFDNVAASMLGGFVIVKTSPRLELIRIQPPKDLSLILAIPDLPIPKRKTEVARAALPKLVPLADVVHNVASASIIVSGFYQRDVKLIAEGVKDVIVEPARKGLIKGYDTVKKYAIKEGALAFTISGAGPSVIAIGNSDKGRDSRIARAMQRGFRDFGINSKTHICRPSQGANIVY
jgi:homoserine kinase